MASENHTSGDEAHVIYHNLWSCCSLMARFSIAASPSASHRDAFIYREKEIDIQHGGQLDEFFICNVNTKGQVPALTHPTRLPQPITDSLDITFYLYDFFPNLNPSDHSQEIKTLLYRLHDINFFVLSFFDKPARGAGLYKMTKEKLDDLSISQSYRSALERKLNLMEKIKDVVLLPETLAKEEAKTREMLKDLEQIRLKHLYNGGSWLYGTSAATALDTHLIIFLCRLRDVGREYLMPETILNYAKDIMDMALWADFMQGRTTMYSY